MEFKKYTYYIIAKTVSIVKHGKARLVSILLRVHTLVVTGRPPAGWTDQEAGLDHPDRILSIEGVPVSRRADLSTELWRHEIGDVVTSVQLLASTLSVFGL